MTTTILHNRSYLDLKPYSHRVALALFFVLLALLPWQTSQAQERTKLQQKLAQVDSVRRIIRARADSNRYIHFADSLLDQRDARARLKYDTTYIGVPRERWTVKARLNLSGNDLLEKGISGGQETRTEMMAAHKLTLSFSVGYRGLTFGLSANPLKWAGKNKDFEYNLNSYGRKFGFDVVYTTANTFSGTYDHGTQRYDIESGSVSQRLANLNAYYAFNHRRFSYPAAFSQSQVQLRSAGSWLLAASVVGCELKYKEGVGGSESPKRIRYANVGLGGGYGYNLVRGRWLIHGSVTSELVAVSWSRMEVGEEQMRMPYRFPCFIVQGRAAAIYSWKNYFMGLTGVCHFSNVGDKEQLSIYSVKWRVRGILGLRF